MKFIQVGCYYNMTDTNIKGKEMLRKFGSGDRFVVCVWKVVMGRIYVDPLVISFLSSQFSV